MTVMPKTTDAQRMWVGACMLHRVLSENQQSMHRLTHACTGIFMLLSYSMQFVRDSLCHCRLLCACISETLSAIAANLKQMQLQGEATNTGQGACIPLGVAFCWVGDCQYT